MGKMETAIFPADDTIRKWERPKTTRRYLHGPFAERLLTFWREGKIAFGEVERGEGKSSTHGRAHVVWLVHGDDDKPFDFREAEMLQPEGGEPDHAQRWHSGPLEVTLAACAPCGRRTSAYVRLTVRNAGTSPVRERVAFLLREGPEDKLLFGAPDVYASFRPSMSDWAEIPPGDWRREGDTMRCGERFVVASGVPFTWDAGTGAVRFAVDLASGEAQSVELEIGGDEPQGLGYAAARETMYAGWAKELGRLRLPAGLDARSARIVRNLAVQMLQCLSVFVGDDCALPRQGGLQRGIWPGDADCFLEALDALGFGDYVARVIDFYYGRRQRPDGEAGPFGCNWAGDTASVLKTFARHCTATDDAECWRRWRDAAFLAFGWIQAKRAEGGGLFPAMKSTDLPIVFRHWGTNDLKALEAFKAFAKATAAFGDPLAAEVAAAEADCRAEIGKILDVWRAKAEGTDELRIPLSPDGNDGPLLAQYMFYSHPGRFADSGLLSEEEMLRLRTWLLRHCRADERGLYQNQPSAEENGGIHVWYVTWSEQQWFRAWRRVGRYDLAAQARDACLRYALTDELYVGERYNDADPWYFPWSPNASGSGRIAMMLLESVEREWPFVVIRHTRYLNTAPDVFAKLVECHRRHPGACDEFWFSTGGRGTVKEMRAVAKRIASFRPLCEEVGIRLSVQQATTLGHTADWWGADNSAPFPDDAMQRDRHGQSLGILCPRSPDAIEYERECVKAMLEIARPDSWWLDDDLRLGGRPMLDGCFCPRCIAAFNEETGCEWTRETLAAALFDAPGRQPVRAAWSDFNARSLAIFAAAVRRAADEIGSACRLAVQTTTADRTWSGRDFRPMLEALSGEGHGPVGIQPGDGFYIEAEPRGMVEKALCVAREAERCRNNPLVATVCYEEDNYPWRILHKSPGAIMTESALALASGCDSLSLYWYSHAAPEPFGEYERFLATLHRARPYFERLAASTRRTRLGGVARFVGSAAGECKDFTLRDRTDFDLACAGIPVTVAESGTKVFYITDKSRAEMTEADKEFLSVSKSFVAGCPSPALVDVSDMGQYPLASRRLKLLDDLDAATGGAFPVRIDACRPLRILPRVLPDGRLDSVTLLNLSIGDTDELSVRVRNPAADTTALLDVKGAPPRPLPVSPGSLPGERVVHLDNIPGWQICTVFFGSDR